MLELFSDMISLAVIITGLLLTLFQYIEIRQRKVMIAVLFYLAMLLSQYFWTASVIVTGDYPGISSFLSYSGWNISYAVMLILVWKLQEKNVREHISPLVFLVIPFAAFQFYLYIPFGGVLNSAYQCLTVTLIAMVCLQSIIWYFGNRGKGAGTPYIHIVVFFYSVIEFGMWTSSCYDFWTENQELYHLFSYLSYIVQLLLPFALRKRFPYTKLRTADEEQEQHFRFLKAVYSFGVSLCCLAGILVGVWMRGKIGAGVSDVTSGNLYDLISAMLFVFSLAVVGFTVVILIALDFRQRSEENEILRREKELAERVSSAKSEFLANMSHEIRTPINAILGMNQMILRTNDVGDARKYACNLESAGKNLLAIINDILDFSKIESGKLEIKSAPYQLSSVLDDSCNMVALRARDKGLLFQMYVDKNMPDRLVGDEVRVGQIITNLLSNAVKYTDTGSVILTVGQRPSEKSDLDLVISVRDTGTGIRDEELDRLFVQFERAEAVRDSTTEGTGLGLSITKRLLDLMNGEIHVKSVFGEGSTFTAIIPQGLFVPAAMGDDRERFEEQIDAKAAYQETFRAPEALVLAVDDTPMNLTVIEELLIQTQIQVETANSGADALVKTREKRYDLILMDQRMPEMDGITTLTGIRAQEDGKNRETPVICVTADAVQGARRRYLAEGFTDYVSKPVDAVYLEEILMKYLPQEKVIRMMKETATPETDMTVREIYSRIDSLRYEDAERYVPSENKLKKRLIMFYEMLERSTDTLEELYTQGDHENFCVKVHALKSAARMVGAMAISELAQELEENSDRIHRGETDEITRDESTRFVQEKTPVLLAAARTLAEALKPYVA